MKFTKVIAAILIAAALGVGGIARAEPVKLRFGWVVVPAELEPLMHLKPEVMKHFGKTYQLDAIHFQGTTPMIGALATGELDIAAIAYSSFALAIENAGMKDLRAVFDEIQDGVEGYNTNSFMVLKDSPIKSVADLKGKVIASNTKGSAIDMAMRAMLFKNHIDANRDVTVIEAQFPNMRAMLAERKVDLVCTPLPFWRDAELQAIARPLFTQKDAIGQSEMIVWAVRTGVLAKQRAAIVDFMEDSLRIRRYFSDPANHKEAVALTAGFLKQPESRIADWIYTKRDYYRDLNGMPDLKALQQNVALQHELGFLKSDLDIPSYADLSLVQEAAKRLK